MKYEGAFEDLTIPNRLSMDLVKESDIEDLVLNGFIESNQKKEIIEEVLGGSEYVRINDEDDYDTFYKLYDITNAQKMAKIVNDIIFEHDYYLNHKNQIYLMNKLNQHLEKLRLFTSGNSVSELILRMYNGIENESLNTKRNVINRILLKKVNTLLLSIVYSFFSDIEFETKGFYDLALISNDVISDEELLKSISKIIKNDVDLIERDKLEDITKIISALEENEKPKGILKFVNEIKVTKDNCLISELKSKLMSFRKKYSTLVIIYKKKKYDKFRIRMNKEYSFTTKEIGVVMKENDKFEKLKDYFPMSIPNDAISGSSSVEGVLISGKIVDLIDLYNRTGKELFNYNVRLGFNKNRQLNDAFSKMLEKSIYNRTNEFINEKLNSFSKPDKDRIESLIRGFQNTLYTISMPILGDSSIEIEPLDLFWFKHNGITLYTTKPLEIAFDKVYINENDISVINGAQTLTTLLKVRREAIENVLEWKLGSVQNTSNIDQLNFIDFVSDTLVKCIVNIIETIEVKVTVLTADIDRIKDITLGLNTQMPLKQEDLTPLSDTVRKLNKHLGKVQIEIVKSGSETSNRLVSPLDFSKIVTLIDSPGKSKNFSRNNVEKFLDSVLNHIKIHENYIDHIDRIFVINSYVDSIWSEISTKDVKDKSEEEKAISRFGKNYFKSYVYQLYSDEENLDFEDLSNIYSSLVEELLSITNGSSKYKLEEKVFKNDQLFEELVLSNNLKKNIKYKLSGDVQDEKTIKRKIEEVLNNASSKSKSLVSQTIKNYIDDDSLTVLTTSKGKINETYSLPSKTVSSILEKIKQSSTDDLITTDKFLLENPFENSYFCNELLKTRLFYVVEKANSTQGAEKYKINRVFKGVFVEEKSDSYFNAIKVYSNFVEAILNEDLTLLYKESDELDFHCKSKGRNSNDKVVLTNNPDFVGTKMSFWINKSFINDTLLSQKKENNKDSA